jgi:hypothetical protein
VSAARDTAFAKVPPGLVPAAEALRAAVRAAGPDLREEVKWGNLCFAGRRSSFIGIVPYARHVNLQFWDGVALDPEGRVLTGTGKSLRHATVTTEAEAARPELAGLIRRAIELDRGRG